MFLLLKLILTASINIATNSNILPHYKHNPNRVLRTSERSRNMKSETLKFFLALFFFILTSFTPSAVVASSFSVVRPAKPHIKKACRKTPYPRLCETSLTIYASRTKKTQQELGRAAMVSSLKAAQNATSIISKLSRRKGSPPYEAQVLGDCIVNLKDSVDELRKAIHAIKSLSHAIDVEFQVVKLLLNPKTFSLIIGFSKFNLVFIF